MSSLIKYGFYSYKAELHCGYAIYDTPDGTHAVRVTFVSQDPQASNYMWEDKVSVGQVTTFIKKVEACPLELHEHENLLESMQRHKHEQEQAQKIDEQERVSLLLANTEPVGREEALRIRLRKKLLARQAPA